MEHSSQTKDLIDLPRDGTVTQFAFQVVSELRRTSGIETGSPKDAILDLLLTHTSSGEVAPLGALYAAMKRSGVTAEQMIDIYFPAAIGKIGTDWHEGDLNILQATLRLSRLQTILRELGRAWVSDSTGHPCGPRVLLALPAGEQHTLGAMIAANQMRRVGVSVRVCLVPKPAQMTELLQKHRFDAVFVSASNRSCLASCADLIKNIRRQPAGGLPVVLGGGILKEMSDDMGLKALADHVGADVATLDVRRALAVCGFGNKAQAAE